MKTTTKTLLALPLALLVACGGGSSTPPPTPPAAATGLAYTDPTSTGWRLVKDPTSTTTHLILDLVAPASTSSLGAGFVLTSDAAKMTWTKVAPADAEYTQNVAYGLGSGATMLKSLVKTNALQVGAFQKTTASPVALSGTVLKVALDFKASAGLAPGDAIPLTVSKAEHVPATGTPDKSIVIAVGTLKAQ